jgi:hypothetical protein
MLSLSVFLEDLIDDLDARTECRHCGGRIVPCDCGFHGYAHWQDAGTRPGEGHIHCPGMPHRLHEPEDADG